MIKNYFKVAWRNLGKQKVYGITNIIGFGAAVTAVLVISIWVQNEVRFDNYHPHADQIYLLKNTYVYDNGEKTATENSPHASIDHLQNDYDEIEDVAYSMRPFTTEISFGDEVYIEPKSLYISKDWFELFEYNFIHGSPTSFFNQIHSLIITESKAKKYFGTANVVGKTLQVDSIDYEIKGVVKDIPSNSSLRFDVFMPFENPTIDGSTNDWMYFTTKVFVRLKKDINPSTVEKKIQYLMEGNIQWTQKGIDIKSELLSLTKLHFDQDLSRITFQIGDYQTVLSFSGLAILLLFVASINYINISIAKAASRMKEIGARKVVGATRSQLFVQFIVEAILNCTLSLIIALVLVYLILPSFNSLFDITLHFSLITYHVLILVFSIWCVMILFTGILPALYLSSFNAVNLFRGIGAFQLGGKTIRKTLLVSQFALAICMVIASLTMYKQLRYIQDDAVSYNKSQVFIAKIPDMLMQQPIGSQVDFESQEKLMADLKKSLKNELLINSHIKNVSISIQPSILNETYQMVGQLDWSSKDPGFQPKYTTWKIDDDFASIMNLQLVEGRWFHKGDDKDINNVILNETAIKEFNIPKPIIGQRFYSNGTEGIIIGIAKDFHFQDFHQKISPIVLHKKSYWGDNIIVQAQPGASMKALGIVENLFKDRFPGKVFSYTFLDEEFDQLYKNDQQSLLVALSFSIISIILSFLGLLGMVFFEIQQRMKEIGVRKILGASVSNIVRLLSTDFLKLILLSILIASPIAWWVMNKWLQDFAYRIEIQWWMFALAGILAVIIALVTVSFQAIKAALANPVNSLRDE